MILNGPSCPELLREETLADILRQTARRSPDHAALKFGDKAITYAELLAAADHIALALARSGIGPGATVGLWLPRGIDLLTAQAGIALNGAAWLPFDADTPIDRIALCLRSAAAKGVLTTRTHLAALRALDLTAWAIEDLLADTKASGELRAASPKDTAYVIYTSGSTGTPKGIAISQRSICHFLRSENQVLGIRCDDVVYQGFSVAFDMSFEEIWISYLVGATIWIAPSEIVGDPEALVSALDRNHITVLHAVPTLMSLIEGELPKVRLINLGGEACPPTLAAHLARSGRQLFNTYGPTETTVTATISILTPDEEVSIGRPLPNYGALIVDESMRLVRAGEVGQLAITGPGLALGYVGLPELTASKFIANPHALSPEASPMYLTGDLARMREDGAIICLGRLDDQVKIRGFRVELGEIETRLSALPGIGAAAVVLRTDNSIESLAAFVVPAAHATIDIAILRERLSAELPAYMVPAVFELLPEMPRLSSGKIDRKTLQKLPLRTQPIDVRNVSSDEDEARLFEALEKLFPGRSLKSSDDFFFDLGGHSLLAARLVSLLRNQPAYRKLSVGDIYRERTIGGITTVMRGLKAAPASAAPTPRKPISVWRHFACGALQCLCLPFLVLCHMASWLAPFFTYHFYTGEPEDSIPQAVMLSLAAFVIVEVLSFGIAIVGKRLLTGRLEPGRYPLWGMTYFRFWLSEKLVVLAPIRLLHGTPWLNAYLRLLGAKIGQDVFIDSLVVTAPELLEIEETADLGANLIISNARVEGGELIVGRVRIGAGACVESNCVLENDTHVGPGAHLGPMSSLAAGRHIPAGEQWAGAPARQEVAARTVLPPRPPASRLRRTMMMGLFATTALAVACLFFLPVFPVFMLIDKLDARYFDIFESDVGPAFAFGFFFLLAIPASALLIALTALMAAGLKRLFLRRLTTGLSAITSLGYYRKWVAARILDASLETLHGLYASVFASTWLRLMGAKIGRRTEISTATGVIPDLLNIGDDSFVADGVTLGDEEQRGGWMSLQTTTIGRRTFLGNGAYVADGAVIPDDLLIGVQTRTPPNESMRPQQVWLGSPAVLLPAREGDLGFDLSLTFRPSTARWCARTIIESLRIVLPMSFVIATGYLIVHLVMPYAEEEQWLRAIGALSLAGCLYGVASFVLILAMKWILVGRYRPGAHPMWSLFVWLSEAVTCAYESLAVPNFLDFLRGTPMLPWALRLLGTRIGRRVFMDTTDVTEFDCVAIGDEAELNHSCGPQTHLFEDRVMKIGEISIGARTSVGAASTILYDSSVGDDARLGPLTLVTKGESIPASSYWTGSPARPAG